MIRRTLHIVLGALLAILAVAAGWIVWQHTRDEVRALDRDLSDLMVLRDSAYVVHDGAAPRLYRDVELFSSAVDTVRFTVSLPQERDERGGRLPVVPVVGGLEIGRESLAYLPDHGENALLAYEYPYGPAYWYEGTEPGELPAIRTAVLNVPAQLTAMTLWAAEQEWADTDRITVFGYSFGALFVPAYYRLAKEHGIRFNKGVLLYGAVDMYRLLRHNLRFDSRAARIGFAKIAAVILRPLEPALHAPHLDTEFLVANGSRDQFIPPALGARLQELVPEPKTTMMLDTPHMHPEATNLIRYLVGICIEWMEERGAVDF